MVYDFTMTVPVTRAMRDRLLSLVSDGDMLPVKAVVFGRPVNLFMIRGEEGMTVTIAGHFLEGRADLVDSIVRVPDNA